MRLATGLHDYAAGIDHLNAAVDLCESYGSALLDFHRYPVRQQPHYRRRFDPRDLLKLSLALLQWNEEDVAADVTAEYLHHLCARHFLEAAHPDVVARMHTKAPASRSVAIHASITEGSERQHYDRNQH